MKKKFQFLSIVALATLPSLYYTCDVLAQTIERIEQLEGHGVSTGLIEKTLDEDVKLPRSEAASGVTVPSFATTLPKDGETIHFYLRKVEFIRGSVIDQMELQDLVMPYLNRDIKLSEFYTIAEHVTRLYRDRGYLLSRAIVPPQEIGSHGIGKIQLVEGYIDSITYEGDISELTTRAKKLAEKIKNSNPLNSKDLERYLLLIKNLPGLEIESILKPSKTHPGAASLVIMAKRKNVDGVLGFNNFGTKYVGPYMANAMVGVNSIFGIDDQFMFQGATTPNVRKLRPTIRDLKHGSFVYNQFVGAEGTMLSLSVSRTESRPGDDIKILDITGSNKTLQFGITHPLWRSRSQSFYLGSNFTIRNSEQGLLNKSVVGRDRLRVIDVNVKWDVADSVRGVTLVNLGISRGLHVLGATSNRSENKSRAKGKSDFTKINLDVSRLQGLWGKFSLFGIVEYQKAFAALLSGERFSYGGSTFFRGYTNSPIIGDAGVKEKIELRYGEMLSSDKEEGFSFLSSYQIYTFWGLGTAWNKKPSEDDRKRTNAAEVGGGARLTLVKDTHVSVEYSRPLKRRIGQFKNPSTLFFSLTQQF